MSKIAVNNGCQSIPYVADLEEVSTRTWFHFTKGLTQNLNLRTHLKLEYNIKSLNYIQHNYNFQASFIFY